MTVLRTGSASDTGLVRSTNQDRSLETGTLFAVADGMGGHVGGEIASQIAIEALERAFGSQPSSRGLTEAVERANLAVWEHSQDHPDLRGMGTTLTAAALVNEDGNDVLVLANVGDSRSYQFQDGRLTQISLDHSVAEEMVRAGEISPAEATVHPQRHILARALGVTAEVAVDAWTVAPSSGDRYLLCSDGLTNELGNNQIAEVLSARADPQQAADVLVEAARRHGGSDNITVVVIDVLVGEETGAETGAETGQAAATGGSPEGRATVGSPGTPVPGADGLSTAVDATGIVPVVRREPGATHPQASPSRRQRRRSRATERRRERGRRLVTIRALVFLVVLAAILVGGYSAVRWFDVNSYYVGLDGNELMIYQGRIGGVLWYHPVVVERTGVTTGNVLSDPLTVGALRSGVQEPSYAAARAYVSGLVRTDTSTHTASASASASAGDARAAPVALRTGPGTTLLGATGTDRLAVSGGQ